MSVEGATYISQLDPTYPTGADGKNEGDNHLRLLKTVLKAQFPNLGAAAVNALAAELNYLVGVTSGIQAQLNAKAPLLSPLLTGIPMAPTAAASVGTPQIATMEAVQNVVANASLGGLGLPSPSGNSGKVLMTLDGTTYGFFEPHPYIHLQDQKASGTNGGSASAGANYRTLNTTIANTITGASVASDEVTLPAGNYAAWGCAAGGNTNFVASLYNTADAAYVASCLGVAGAPNGFSAFHGRFTIAATKTFKVRQDSDSSATTGLGSAKSRGAFEVYTNLMIVKLPV